MLPFGASEGLIIFSKMNSLNTFIVFFLLLTTQATNIWQFCKIIEHLPTQWSIICPCISIIILYFSIL